MRFYTGQHRHYCGVDLHTRTMYICILDGAGQVLLHQNLPSEPEAFLAAMAPCRDVPRDRLRVHLHLVLAGRSVRRVSRSSDRRFFFSGSRGRSFDISRSPTDRR